MRAFAILATVAVAAQKNFPKDDAFHADCHVSATFDGVSCDTLYALTDAEIRSWDSDTKSPSAGVYTLKEESNDVYIWSTRLTKNKKYTDDQMFEFTSHSAGCTVAGHSRSQSMSVLDNSVNFCNLWNVYNATANPFTYSVGSCASTPSDVATTCARY